MWKGIAGMGVRQPLTAGQCAASPSPLRCGAPPKARLEAAGCLIQRPVVASSCAMSRHGEERVQQAAWLGRSSEVTVCRARQRLVRGRRTPTSDGVTDTLQEEDEVGSGVEVTDQGGEGRNEQVKSSQLATRPEADDSVTALASPASPALASSQGVPARKVMTEREMEKMRIDVSRRIRQCGKEGNLAAAIEAFTEMQIEGVSPDVVAATALIDCCVRCGEIARAERAFSSLFSSPLSSTPPGPGGSRASLKPDAIVVGVMLRAYGQKNPPQWSKIQQLLSRMEAEFGLQPSAAIFNELVDICARDNEVDRGMQLLERMAQAGVEPDEYTFAAVKRRRSLRSHFKKLFMA